MEKQNIATHAGLLGDFLTKDQLAAELKNSTRTLDRWEVRRIGPPRIVIGRTILYQRDSVLEWLKSREQRNASRR
jgi:hypothetical protein